MALVACAVLVILGPGSSMRLDGALGAGVHAGVTVRAGQLADYTSWLRNNSQGEITLESASIIPVPGFRTPRLVHLAIELGHQFAGAARGFPPSGNSWILRRFRGYRVAPGHQVLIMYSVVGDALGDYAAEGVHVTVAQGSATASVDSLSNSLTCVRTHFLRRGCSNAAENRLEAVTAGEPTSS